MRFHTIICAVALSVGACSFAASPAETGTWEDRADLYRNVCSILWNGTQSQVAIHSTQVADLAGMNIHSPALSFVKPGKVEPNVEVHVDGQPLPAAVLGARPNVVFLSFDPMPLLERHPTGFEVVVVRQGAEIQRLDLDGAAEAFEDLRTCSRMLPSADSIRQPEGRPSGS